MKKLISLVLLFVLLASFVVTVGAEPMLPEWEEYYQKLADELMPVFSEYYAQQTGGANVTDFRVLHLGPVSYSYDNFEYYVIGFDTDAKVEKDVYYRIGMYVVEGDYEYPLFPEGNAVYTIADGQWHPLSYLENLYNGQGFIHSLYLTDRKEFWPSRIYELDKFLPEGYTISTATCIQKYLAKLDVSEYGIEEKQYKYLDIDNDGEVTIKDATTLQKFIAGLDVYIHDSVV